MIGGYHPWYHEELVRRVEEARNTRSTALATGMQDELAGYKYECGVIEGLRLATDIADEIKREMDSQ